MKKSLFLFLLLISIGTFSQEKDNDNKIDGLQITDVKPNNLVIIERNKTKMRLPFNGEWEVFWGGDTKEQNYHVAYENQKHAYDFVIRKDGETHTGDPTKNENYYAFGKDVLAPCDAKVVKVITGIEDNIPGELNTEEVAGNLVILETANKEYIVLAHLKKGATVVREGLFVRKGGLLGKSGNSGNSMEPHLHLSLQNTLDINSATAARIHFNRIYVHGEIKQDYLPVKGDVVKNRN